MVEKRADAPQSSQLKSSEFRSEREATWLALDRIVTKAERKRIGILSAKELASLPMLYRATLSSLSVARSISLDRNVVEYLESLTSRAYFCVYGPKRHLREVLARFFAVKFPSVFRKYRWQMALSLLFLLLGTLAGLLLTLEDPERYYSFISEDMAQGRDPAATDRELREVLFSEDANPADALTAFATFLFAHNSSVGILAFALGFLAGLPVFLLLFTNGLMLGAMGALYQSRGLGVEWWSWVMPHGVTELLAIAVCGGAGLVIAQSLIFPGRHTRLANLGIKGREAGILVMGAIAMLFIAGLIEGIFRQTVHSLLLRYMMVTITAAFWIFYFGWVGRRGRP